jgi:L-alanine-DL-glutamate epimerase-like enolase superfamily enzyme
VAPAQHGRRRGPRRRLRHGLSGYLADRVSALRAEVDAAIHDAYAASYDERVIDGISGRRRSAVLTGIATPPGGTASLMPPRICATPA